MSAFFCNLPRRLWCGLLLALLTGCNARQDGGSLPVELPDGFEAFYQQFHHDSLFQMEHITWPLAGQTGVYTDSTSMVVVDVEWMPETWRMHRPADLSGGAYKRVFRKVGEFMVIERITTTVGNFGLERRFAQYDNGRWELIYYADVVAGGQ